MAPDKFIVQSVSMFCKLRFEWFGMVCPCVKVERARAQAFQCIFKTHDSKAELKEKYTHCLMTENCQTAPVSAVSTILVYTNEIHTKWD